MVNNPLVAGLVCGDSAFEAALSADVKQEWQLFHATFSLKDRAEGMQAFTEKRTAKFQNK